MKSLMDGLLMDSQSRLETLERQSKLFDLPPEIRSYIYTLALTVDSGEDGKVLLFKGARRISMQPPSVLMLLLVCRTILREAEGIFYAIHNLKCRYDQDFRHHNEVRSFFSKLGPGRRAAVRNLEIEVWDAEYVKYALEELQYFPRLRILTFRFVTLSIPVRLPGSAWRFPPFIQGAFDQECDKIVQAAEKLESLPEMFLLYTRPDTPNTNDAWIQEQLRDLENALKDMRRRRKEASWPWTSLMFGSHRSSKCTAT